MYNWKLPHVNSSLNLWGIALWQHTILTVFTDWALRNLKRNRSAVFPKIRLCENKRESSFFEFNRISPIFRGEQQEVERWKEADTYAASTRYWLRDVAYHNFDTYQDWQCLIENRISTNVLLKTYLRWSHNLLKPKLIFKNTRIKAYFDA